jgi:hypothetical protein
MKFRFSLTIFAAFEKKLPLRLSLQKVEENDYYSKICTFHQVLSRKANHEGWTEQDAHGGDKNEHTEFALKV